LAVLDSWRRAPREFRVDLGWDFAAEWRSAASKNEGRPENFFGFDKWKEAAETFLRLAERFPDRVRVVRYLDLLVACRPTVEGLFGFYGLPVEGQTIEFLAASSAKHSEE